MCQYTIHCPLDQLQKVIITRNPKPLIDFLNDVRCRQCSAKARQSRSATCKTISYSDIHIKPDSRPCRSSCDREHRDGFHVSKVTFLKLVGTNAKDWVKKLADSVKAKQAKRAEKGHGDRAAVDPPPYDRVMAEEKALKAKAEPRDRRDRRRDRERERERI